MSTILQIQNAIMVIPITYTMNGCASIQCVTA